MQKSKGKGAKAAERTPAAPSAPDAKKKINLNLETLQTFMTFGLDIPQTSADMAAAIDKVRIAVLRRE